MKRVLTVFLALVLVTLFGGTLVYLWTKSREKPVVYATEAPTSSRRRWPPAR
jgi:HlyD family secretion protein